MRAVMRCLGVTVAAGLLCAPAVRADVQRVAVEDFRPLLVQAIDAMDGQAHGVLVGPMAEVIATQVHAAGPVLIDVSTLKRYSQPGCSRLNVRFTQRGVRGPGQATPRDETLDLGMNYCRDGTPSRSLN